MSSSKEPRLPPLEASQAVLARGEDTRIALLIAALEAFAQYGYDAMSVRGLTRSLDVSHNIVHHHFQSKKELWRAAVGFALEDAIGDAAKVFHEAATQSIKDPIDAIRNVIRKAILVFARFPALARIIAHESAQPSERLDFLFERYIGPTEAALKEFVRRLNKGGIRDLDLHAATLFLLGGIPALFTHAGLANKLGGLDASSQAIVDAYADVVANLVAGGLGAKG